MKYFFLGLEARLRGDNTYQKEAEAIEAAVHCAKKNALPVRIFVMDEFNKSHLYTVIKADGTQDVILYKPMTFYPEDEKAIRCLFDGALMRIRQVPTYYNCFKVHGLEAALKQYLNAENEHPEYMLKAIKQTVGDLEKIFL